MKKMHKSLIGAIIGLVCANSAMAANCDIVSNRDPLSGALKFIGGGIGLATSTIVAPFAGLVARPLGITAVSIGGIYLGAKVGAKVYAKDDYICFDSDGKKCLQCDIHQIGKPYECNDGKVVLAPGLSKRCHTRMIGKDTWKDFKVPMCNGAKKLTGDEGSVIAVVNSRLIKNLASQGVSGAFVVEDDVCYTYKCADGYNEKDGKCTKKGGSDGGVDEQKCYDRGGIPMTNGNCRCPDGEWYSEKAKHCTPKNGCGDCKGGVFIIADNGSVVIVGDNNNVSSGGNHNTYNGGGSSSLQKCLAEPVRQGKPELLACCYLSADGMGGAKPDFVTGKCKCNDTSKTFSIDANGHGQCTGGNPINPNPINPNPVNPNPVNPNPVNPTPIQCPQNMAPDANNVCQCTKANQTAINNNTACQCSIPNATNDANGECKCNDKDMVVKDGQCVMDESKIAEIRGRITATFSRLSSTMGGFEKSVWKNAEGEFNTARLASDSIAGVVLGTAGGIITSKLVKKNQLKTGFEDIKCSIGGQTVASYGDTFTVGM